jgi:flagellar biosynthesis/type III secretory pathway chaperone
MSLKNSFILKGFFLLRGGSLLEARMAGMINDLLDVLAQQAQTYEELYGLSQEKKDAIVKDEIDEIQKITNLENILLSQHSRIDKKRLQLMKDIAVVLGVKNQTMDIPGLIELLEGQDEQDTLRQVRLRMRTALDKLTAANRLNATLVQNALDYIEYSLNVIRSSASQEVSTYSVHGGVLKEDGNLMDIRN